MTSPAATASDVMVPNPPTVDPDETIAQVRAAMEAARSHHAVVLDAGRVVGVVSESDVLGALSPNLRTASETERDLATLHKRVHQVMSRQPLVATPDTPVGELVDTFRARTIGCLPIVDEDQALLGLVTLRSLLFALSVDRG